MTIVSNNASTNSGAAKPPRPTPLIDRIPGPFWPILLGVCIVSLWHYVTASGAVSPIILPPPAAVWRDILFTFGNFFQGGYVAKATWVTFQEVILGFLLASTVGLLLGSLIGVTDIGRKMLTPYVVAINTMPKVAFAPLFVAWFGFGIESKIMMAAFISFFPVTINTATGLNSVPADMRMLFKSMEASRWQELIKLRMPASIPYIFAGLRLAAAWSVIGAVVGEYMGGGKGLGELVRVSASQLDIGRVFSQIMILSLMGLSIFGLVAVIEKRLTQWKEE